MDLNSISEASNSACAWNIAPVFHVGQKCFSEGAISDCLSGDPHRPWHERKLVLETDARESSFHCSSMCSSASTVVSSTSSTEIPLSFSSTVHDPYHFANPQPANRPDAVHGWFVTPAATLPTLPFSVRPLPPRSAAAHAAEGRDFVRLFEAASSGVGGGGGGGCGGCGGGLTRRQRRQSREPWSRRTCTPRAAAAGEGAVKSARGARGAERGWGARLGEGSFTRIGPQSRRGC